MPNAAPIHRPALAPGIRHGTSTGKQYDHAFLSSAAWRKVRMLALARDKGLCRAEGCGQPVGTSGHVDHIIDRSERPDLALVLDNLQTMCHSCHSRKTRGRGGQISSGY